MAAISSEPIPGTRKICSVTTAPAKIVGIWSAMTVTTGISALRTTCLPIVRASESPLARAVLTYSSRTTSRTAARTNRVRVAPWKSPSTATGMMACRACSINQRHPRASMSAR